MTQAREMKVHVWSGETLLVVHHLDLKQGQGMILRFRLAEMLARLHYGDEVRISSEVVQAAWPPTGDYDRTNEAIFRSFALAMGGHRPETSYTSLERIERDLPDDGSYVIRDDILTGGISIFRKLSACRCRGTGFISTVVPTPIKWTSHEEVVELKSEPCDHQPRR